MYGSKKTDNGNYRSLVIAGIGTIGRSLVSLGIDRFSAFDAVFAIDRKAGSLLPLQNSGIICRAGDIAEAQFLRKIMAQVTGPALFVNLCSNTDNVKIRKNLTRYETAYLDSCASTTEDPAECRFSRLMPYTYADIDINYPHWLCWGINPGLVELMARRILTELPDIPRTYDVNIYEFDRLAAGPQAAGAPVGWCPDALVEEMMLSPTMEIVDGRPRESEGPGALEGLVNWGSRAVPARIVGHEDIWNLAEIPAVKNARFYYSLNAGAMEILSMTDAKQAGDLLYIPAAGEGITGLEQIAVQIRAADMPEPRTLVWTEDHAATWKRYGINAVQYQTAKSLLLGIMLLQHTSYGHKVLAANGSNLPITPGDWDVIEHFMLELGINWHDGSHLNLHAAGVQ